MKEALIILIVIMITSITIGIVVKQEEGYTIQASMVRQQSPEEDDGWKLIGQKGYCKLYHKAYRNNQSVYWTVCSGGQTASVSVGQLNP